MKGIIDRIWQNKTKDEKNYWVLNIDGQNYSVWDKKYIEGLQEGAMVEYEWATSGDFKKIVEIRKIDGQPTREREDKLHARNQQIIRMSCIKSATMLVSNSDGDPDEKGTMTLGLARKFERYVTDGDEDQKPAREE